MTNATVLSPTSRALALVVILTGALLPPLDFFIANVAVPAIRETLSASPAEIQLVISGYAAGYAVFLIPGGRLGDLFGRRRLFILGMAGFTLTSALCGFATSGAMLDAARIVEGTSAAIMAPQVLGSIRGLYAEHELGRALSLYSTMVGLAAAVGQMLGGALIALDLFGLGWRLVFIINLPIGICAMFGASVLLPETSRRTAQSLDICGALLLLATLCALILPLSVGRDQGWPLWTFLSLAVFPLLWAAFMRFERRVAHLGAMPLFDIDLLRRPGFKGSLLIAFLFFFTTPFYLGFSLYLQEGRGIDALGAGLAILPYGIGCLLGALLTTPFPPWLRAHQFTVGMGCELVGYAGIMLCVGAQADGWPLVVILALAGFGQGVAMPRVVDMVLSAVPSSHAGLAAGILNSTLQIGAAVSVAVIGSIFYEVLGSQTGAAAYAHALQVALAAIVGVFILALVLGLLPQGRR
ncbi:MAG: major facilitator superfamily 1 [Rhodospirillales bacterium]|nr:major facilitator superfamily 1 [Rhodospirillales bacterium]